MEKIGKYEIIEELGKGGMGIVYKGRDPFIERNVAIKVLNESMLAIPEFNQRFLREARAAGNISHENITTVYDAGQEGERLYIVMEYLEGRELRDLIEFGETISLEEKIDYAIQICRGLKKAHDCGIIHRDVKPENIFITDDDVVKLMDFGIAKPSASNLTLTQTIMGTPHYMSPEQVKGTDIGKSSDIFSFGVLFYELLTNRRPFTGDRIESIMYKIVNDEPDEIVLEERLIGEKLYKIVSKCLAKKPIDRYLDMGEVISALQEIGRDQSTQPVRPAPTQDLEKTVATKTEADAQPKRTSPIVPVAGGLLILTVFVIYYLVGPPRNEQNPGEFFASDAMPAGEEDEPAAAVSTEDTLAAGSSLDMASIETDLQMEEVIRAENLARDVREKAQRAKASKTATFIEGTRFYDQGLDAKQKQEYTTSIHHFNSAEDRFHDAVKQVQKPENPGPGLAGDAERLKTTALKTQADALNTREEVEKDNAIAFAVTLFTKGTDFESSGEHLLQKKDYAGAQDSFQKAISCYEGVLQARQIHALAEQLFQSGQYEETLVELKKFDRESEKLATLVKDVTVAKATAESHLMNARSQLASGNLKGALALFETLPRRDQTTFPFQQLRRDIIAGDQRAPVISHTELKNYKPKESLAIEAAVEDNLQVEEVNLYYQRKDLKEYQRVSMKLTESGKFQASIPSDQHDGREIRYFFTARDINGNESAAGSENKPFKVKAESKGFIPPNI
jgi:serine/threonine-protein kinase